jgi:hypothetical protein
MVMHAKLQDLIRESLTEYLEMARYAITTTKPAGGCYGFPGALLLLAITDAIGSFCRGNRNVIIQIDGQTKIIKKPKAHHFWILNSRFYGMSLTGKQISEVYECFRCLLAHNGSLPPGKLLSNSPAEDPPFGIDPDNEVEVIYLHAFLARTETAVSRFLAEIEGIVSSSQQAQIILRKQTS